MADTSDRATDLICMRVNLKICRDVAAEALSGELLERIDRSLGELLAIVTREIAREGDNPRGGRLRLVVDNAEQRP